MRKFVVIVLLALILCSALVVEAKRGRKKHQKQPKSVLSPNTPAEEPQADAAQCGCSWANAGSCGTSFLFII